MKLLGAALILCGAAPNAMRCSAHGGRSVPPCGSFPPHWRAWSAGYAPRSCRCRGCSDSAARGKYADAFFADVLARSWRMGRRCRTAGAKPPPGRRSASGSRLLLSGLADAFGGEEDAVLRALRAAAQALRGTLTERERQSARDTRLVTTLCFSLSLLVTILLI